MMWVGTMVLTPFDRSAGLKEPDAVWPFTTGSVSTISKCGALGNFDRDGVAFEQLQLHVHILGQVGCGIANDVSADMQLVESLRLHEHILFAILVQILEVLVLHEGLFDAVGGAQAFYRLHAIADAAHFQMGDGRALAGMDVLGIDDQIELAVLLQDIAFAHGAGDNRNHGKTSQIGEIWGVFSREALDPQMSWWSPQTHADRRPLLMQRAADKGLNSWAFSGLGLHRGRVRGLGGFARQRDPSACL